jgi:hypothetical protein
MVATRQDQLASIHGSGIREAPGVHVEHGHDGENRVVAAKVQLVGERDGQGMQGNGPVRIEDSFGAAGSSRGVAQGRCIVFRELDFVPLSTCFLQEILISFAPLGEPAAAVIDDKDAFKVDFVPDLLEEVEQHIIHN